MRYTVRILSLLSCIFVLSHIITLSSSAAFISTATIMMSSAAQEVPVPDYVGSPDEAITQLTQEEIDAILLPDADTARIVLTVVSVIVLIIVIGVSYYFRKKRLK